MKTRVVVIDDEAEVCELIGKVLMRSGHEVLEWLRAQDDLRRLPVVVLTSSREPNDINRAYDLGANSYLVKPVSFDALLEMVQVLERYWIVLAERPEAPRARPPR